MTPSSTYRPKRAPVVKPDYNSPTPPYQIPQHQPPTKKKQTRLSQSYPSPSKFLLSQLQTLHSIQVLKPPLPPYRQAHNSALSAPPSSPGNSPSPTASRNPCARNKVFRIRTSDLQRRIQAREGNTGQPHTPRPTLPPFFSPPPRLPGGDPLHEA